VRKSNKQGKQTKKFQINIVNIEKEKKARAIETQRMK